MVNRKTPWIKSAYKIFANEGPQALKVEAIARQVNKSKSSFYHFFVDMDNFIDELLSYHLKRAAIIAEKEKACSNVDPELFEVLITYKEDLLFNRQLRIHRKEERYRQCFEQTSREVANAISEIWAEALGIPNQSFLAELVLNLSMENFFLQITEETLNHTWLKKYVSELKAMVVAIKQQGSGQ